MTDPRPAPATASSAPSDGGPITGRDASTVHLARAAFRHLAEHGMAPTPANYQLAWEAVGGTRPPETAEVQPAADQLDEAMRQADALRKTQAELLEIVRALCDSIEGVAEQDSWLVAQVQALREAVSGDVDRRTLAAARSMLENTRQAQQGLARSRRDALGALRGLLPDLIAQMSRLGERSGEFGAALSGHLESISRADSIEAIADEVRQLMADARSMSESVEQARDRLEGGARQADALQQQVARLEEQLARTSELLLTDHLTQTANRTGLEQAFNSALMGVRTGEPVAVALLDVDDFKRVNDALGHFAGDGVLRHLAGLLKGLVRDSDTVARYGGEEFVLLLLQRAQDEARECLVRAQRELTRSVYLHEARKVFITFSAGLTMVRTDDTLGSALARADEAMYRSKRAGKNCVTVV